MTRDHSRHQPITPPTFTPQPPVVFQAGAYAEFRVDWPEALRQYELAYRQLQRAAPVVADASRTPLQRFFEVLSVAEVLSIKVCGKPCCCQLGSLRVGFGVWVCGCVGVWVCGCVGVWVWD